MQLREVFGDLFPGLKIGGVQGHLRSTVVIRTDSVTLMRRLPDMLQPLVFPSEGLDHLRTIREWTNVRAEA